MGILSRLQSIRRAGESLLAERLRGEARSLSAEIPGRDGPLWQMRVEIDSQPQAGGERLRVRAHFKLSLRRTSSSSAQAQFTAAPPAQPSAAVGTDASPPVAAEQSLPHKVGQWIEQRLDSPLMRTLTAPLLDRDLNTWVEMQTSTAPLDAGAKALLPAQLARLGIEPRDDLPVQAWAGELRGARPGFAQMTLLQLDSRHIPPNLQPLFAERPFQLSAALVNVIEDAAGSR